MSENSEPLYATIADFQVDGDQLLGFSIQEIFMLGVEFGYAIIYAQQDAAYKQRVMPGNIQRVEALLWRYGRRYVVERTIGNPKVTFLVEQKR